MSLTVYEGKGLKILADIEDNHVKLYSKSILSPVGKYIINLMNKYYAHERPLKIEDDQIHFSGWIPPMPSKAFTRLFNNEMKIKITGRLIPGQVSIAVTGRCPCNCIFCCAKGIRAEPELTLEEMKSIIDQSLDLGSHLLTFDGGEPLLRDDIYDIISYVDDRAITVMFTNGLKLTRDVAKKLKKAGLRCLQVSIDSPFEEEHDKIRGIKGIFKKATEGLKYASEEGLLTSIYYVARPENTTHENLNALLDLAKKTNADEISIYDIIAIGKWLTHEAETMTDDDRARTIDFHKKINTYGMSGPKVMSFSYFESPEKFGCMAGSRWIHISPSGDVIPCSYTPLTFGNIREESIYNIYKKIRKHPEYKKNIKCLIQDKEFRSKYIYPIPKDASLPYPIEKFNQKK